MKVKDYYFYSGTVYKGGDANSTISVSGVIEAIHDEGYSPSDAYDAAIDKAKEATEHPIVSVVLTTFNKV